MKDINKRLLNYMIRVSDGLVFGLFATLLSYTIFYSVLGVDLSYFSLVLISNLFIFLSICVLTLERKVFLISVLVVMIYIYLLNLTIV